MRYSKFGRNSPVSTLPDPQRHLVVVWWSSCGLFVCGSFHAGEIRRSRNGVACPRGTGCLKELPVKRGKLARDHRTRPLRRTHPPCTHAWSQRRYRTVKSWRRGRRQRAWTGLRGSAWFGRPRAWRVGVARWGAALGCLRSGSSGDAEPLLGGAAPSPPHQSRRAAHNPATAIRHAPNRTALAYAQPTRRTAWRPNLAGVLRTARRYRRNKVRRRQGCSRADDPDRQTDGLERRPQRAATACRRRLRSRQSGELDATASPAASPRDSARRRAARRSCSRPLAPRGGPLRARRRREGRPRPGGLRGLCRCVRRRARGGRPGVAGRSCAARPRCGCARRSASSFPRAHSLREPRTPARPLTCS